MADQRPQPPDDEIFHVDNSSPFKESCAEVWESLVGVAAIVYPRWRKKPPELVLESKPIPVKSIWSPSKPLSSRLTSVGIHVAVIVILLLPFWQPVRKQIQKAMDVQEIFVPETVPQVQLPRMRKLSGGGIPQIQAPKVVQTPHPRPMAVTPTLLAPVLTTENVPTFGTLGPIAGPPGVGGGQNGGPGGMGTGPGSPNGNCVSGPGCYGFGEVPTDGPVLIFQPEPHYTEAARKARFQGTCVVQIVVGADGTVHDAKVVQPLGLGLDEQAVAAVMRYRFQPARDRNGKPIAVLATVDVNFRLY